MKITKFNLFFWYIVRNKSQRKVAEHFGVTRRVITRLTRYGIKKGKYLMKKSMANSFFKKGHQINTRRKRPDMVKNTYWKGKK